MKLLTLAGVTVACLVLVVLALSQSMVLSQLSSITLPHSFVIYQSGSYYYAERSDGSILCNNTSASVVINNALGNLSTYYGGEVFLKAPPNGSSGYYLITSTILLPSKATLEGENKQVTLYLANNANCDILKINNMHNVQIRNLRIFGNKANNVLNDSNGLVISGGSFDSVCIIENLLIENCSRNGIWNQNGPRDNTFRTIETANCNECGVRIDTSDDKLIDVASGWAGWSGFQIFGMSNYLFQCVSWASGMRNDPLSEYSSGFYVANQRQMLVGCDASVNNGSGYLLSGASQCMLTGCIARTNGKRTPSTSPFGYNLYNTQYTILTGCTAVNEQGASQTYGYNEGGTSDYNQVIGCNFYSSVQPIGTLGLHTVVRDVEGYIQETSKRTNSTIAIGLNNVYGAYSSITSPTGIFSGFDIKIVWSGTFSSETVTVEVSAVGMDGTTSAITKSATAIGQTWLTLDDKFALWIGQNKIQQIRFRAKTTRASTSVGASFCMFGSG